MLGNLLDTQQSWEVLADGTARRMPTISGEPKFSVQEYYMVNPSLSGRGKALKKSAPKEFYSAYTEKTGTVSAEPEQNTQEKA